MDSWDTRILTWFNLFDYYLLGDYWANSKMCWWSNGDDDVLAMLHLHAIFHTHVLATSLVSYHFFLFFLGKVCVKCMHVHSILYYILIQKLKIIYLLSGVSALQVILQFLSFFNNYDQKIAYNTLVLHFDFYMCCCSIIKIQILSHTSL